ncbi:MAG TPA: VOC family protein [Candidatus Baltobacteraceae bacterium]|nr:VOC family protein [Candidatus Baltobacteraceae bacterium]
MHEFYGFDHIDCRVRSLAAVEAFYDDLMPEVGLTEKRYAYVDPDGEWHREFDAYNAIEYYEAAHPTKPRRFFGVIENPLHRNNDTRIAFRVAYERLDELIAVLRRIGAAGIELSEEMETYPAVFFEDPAGTKLELIGREV